MIEDRILNKLQQLYACGSAREYVRACLDPQSGWDTCIRGDWMLWLLESLKRAKHHSAPDPENPTDMKKLIACCLDCLALIEVSPVFDMTVFEQAIKEIRELRYNEETRRGILTDTNHEESFIRHFAWAILSLYGIISKFYEGETDGFVSHVIKCRYATNHPATITLSDIADVIRKHFPICPLL